MLKVTFFTRKQCHLCDQAEADLAALQEKFPHRLVVIDIDGSPELEAAYGFEIPVVEVGPYTLRAPFDRQKLEMTLGAAQDLLQHKTPAQKDTPPPRRSKAAGGVSGMDRFAIWFAKRYMLVFNLFVFIYVGLPFLAPVLLNAGAVAPANVIYRVYSGLCHQLAYRSFFLYGDQIVYPRAAANVEGLTTFQQATGFDESSLDPARAVRGDEEGLEYNLGYKVALCQRDVAMYLAMLIFGVAFVAFGKKWKPLPLWAWLLFGVFPIGFDGGTQLLTMIFDFGTTPFWENLSAIFPLRESTPYLRVLTGGLFGLTSAWLGYPNVEMIMAQSRIDLAKKIAYLSRTHQPKD